MPDSFVNDFTPLAEPSFKPPVSFPDAERRARELLGRLSRTEKLQLISGHNTFFIRGFPAHGIPELYLSDATGGVNIRRTLSNALEKSTAFPCPLALAATWNPDLAYQYARSIGEECRAGAIAFLLGPGMNLYRHSQCGRNFEYWGEDPHLAARLVERYVTGVLDTGTLPTIKHFVANEAEFYRRTSNSVVDERTLRELYLPAFKAGIDAGAPAVMTAYNQLNGEWCGQSRTVITDLLRGKLGFKGMVMTDWNSVWDAELLMKSGQDLEMPGEKLVAGEAERLLQAGRITEADIDRMAGNILRTCIAYGLFDRPIGDTYYLGKFAAHEQVALQTARESIVLLKNNGILPLPPQGDGRILLTGLFVEKIPHGGGSAEVEGFNHVTLLQALRDTYGDRLECVGEPTDAQLRDAAVVLLSTGTIDSEGWDRPFALPDAEEDRVKRAASLNPRTVVLINSGGGIRMTGWHDSVAAIVHAWYPGQNGYRALAETLVGAFSPSGRLPITIEQEFHDSPGAHYLPPHEKIYSGWGPDNDMSHPVYDIVYAEGVFVGYRWYESKRIKPLYAFGHGLSYTAFSYDRLRLTPAAIAGDERVSIEFSITNTGAVAGTEVAQIYVRDLQPTVARPEKELKAFVRAALQPGETKNVRVRLDRRAFAYWDVAAHAWRADAHDYELLVGAASDNIKLRGHVTLQ